MKIIGMILLVALQSWGKVVSCATFKGTVWTSSDTAISNANFVIDTNVTIGQFRLISNHTLTETGTTVLTLTCTDRSMIDSSTATTKQYPDTLYKAGRLYVIAAAGAASALGSKVIVQTASAKDTVLKASYGSLIKTYKLVDNISYQVSPNITIGTGKPIVMGNSDTLICNGTLFCGTNLPNDTIPICGTGCVFQITNWQIPSVGSTGTLYINPFTNTGSVSIGVFSGTPTFSFLGNITASINLSLTGGYSGTSASTSRVPYNTNGFTIKTKKLTIGGAGTATGRAIITAGSSLINADTITTLATSTHATDTINLQTSTIRCGVFNIADTNSVWNAGTSTVRSDTGVIGNWTLRGRTLYDVNINRTSGTHTNNDMLKCHKLTVAPTNTQAVSLSGTGMVLSGDLQADGSGTLDMGNFCVANGANSTVHLGSTLGTVTASSCVLTMNTATAGVIDVDKSSTTFGPLTINGSCSNTGSGSIFQSPTTCLTLTPSSSFTVTTGFTIRPTASQSIWSLGAGYTLGGPGTSTITVYSTAASRIVSTIPAVSAPTVSFILREVGVPSINSLSGAITCKNLSVFSSFQTDTFTTNGNSLTCETFKYGTESSTVGRFVMKFGSSTLNCTSLSNQYANGTNVFLFLDSSTVNCSGAYTYLSTNSISEGTSTIRATGTGTWTPTGKPFYRLRVAMPPASTFTVAGTDSIVSTFFCVDSGLIAGNRPFRLTNFCALKDSTYLGTGVLTVADTIRIKAGGALKMPAVYNINGSAGNLTRVISSVPNTQARMWIGADGSNSYVYWRDVCVKGGTITCPWSSGCRSGGGGKCP